MKIRIRFLLAALVVLRVPVRAEGPPADHPLAALSWLVGGMWVTELQSSDGRPLRVEARFEWAGHGRTLHYVIDFNRGDETATQYDGLYYWHPGRKHIAMMQVDRNGNITESAAKVDGNVMTQENQATQTDGTTRPQRVSVTREGDDEFAFRAMIQREGKWVDAVGLTYKRERRQSP